MRYSHTGEDIKRGIVVIPLDYELRDFHKEIIKAYHSEMEKSGDNEECFEYHDQKHRQNVFEDIIHFI